MRLDYEKYRHHLALLELSREDEDEIMDSLWGMVASHILAAHDKHPVQNCRGKIETSNLQSHNSAIRLNH